MSSGNKNEHVRTMADWLLDNVCWFLAYTFSVVSNSSSNGQPAAVLMIPTWHTLPYCEKHTATMRAVLQCQCIHITGEAAGQERAGQLAGHLQHAG
jgi:hypothetical protein